MNRHRKPVIVPQRWVGYARTVAEVMIWVYANGGSPASRARSGNRGTESNLRRQWQGKVGEIATALYFDLDPKQAVNCSFLPDHGADIALPSGLLLDVKTTLAPFKLIWSRDCNDIYWEKRFDHLVSVSIDEDDFSRCWIEGFVPKQEFFARKQIAEPGRSRLEPGTWFMDKAALHDIEGLKQKTAPVGGAGAAFEEACRKGQREYMSDEMPLASSLSQWPFENADDDAQDDQHRGGPHQR